MSRRACTAIPRRLAFLVFALGCLLLAGGVTRADDRMDEAHLHHKNGVSEYEAGRYAPALAEFERAYALTPFPELLFNMGRCAEAIGDLDRAIDYLERYLAVSPGQRRSEIQARLVELRTRRAAISAPSVNESVPSRTASVSPATNLEPARVIASEVPRRNRHRTAIAVGVSVGVFSIGLGLGLGFGLQKGTRHLEAIDLRSAP